jgi:hypothetical protein
MTMTTKKNGTSTTSTATSTSTSTRTTRRLVLFVGPHKSASSTVQEFLVQYATGRPRYRKLKAFQGWQWPLVRQKPSSSSNSNSNSISNLSSRVPARKQWAPLVYTQPQQNGGSNQSDTDESSLIRKELQTALQETFEKFSNVVVGSEELDRFGPTPWSHRDGMGAVHQLIDWAAAAAAAAATAAATATATATATAAQQHASSTPTLLQVDVVVNYRTPRHSQWISIWKQLMSLEESVHNRESMSYPEWICQHENEEQTMTTNNYFNDKVWEYLDCVANPLGLTLALLDTLSERYTSTSANAITAIDWKVTLMDMGGVMRRNLDIAHVSACQVLNLPCNVDKGWVRGINRTLVVNPKSRPLELSPFQLVELEWLLRQRDCTYRERLQEYERHEKLVVVYPDDDGLSWKHCSTTSSTTSTDTAAETKRLSNNFQNTTYLLQAMQSQFGCQQPQNQHINLTRMMQLMAEEQSTSDHDHDPVLRVVPATTTNKKALVLFGQESTTTATMDQQQHDWIWIQLLQWAVLALLFAGLLQIRKRRKRRR